MNKCIAPQSKSVRVLSDIISANPGISSDAVAAKAGYSVSHVGNALSVLAELDIALPVPTGGTDRGWFPAEQAKIMLKAHAEAKARKMAVKLDRKLNPPVTDRGNIVLMAKEPEGASYARMIGELKINHHSLGNHCPKLVKRGKIFKAIRKGCRTRWFDTQERATAWEALPPMVPSEWSSPGFKAWEDNPTRKRKLVEIGKPIKSSARQPSKPPPKPVKPAKKTAQPAGVNIQKLSFADRPADYSGAKITRIPAPAITCAWQAQPSTNQSIFADWPRYGTGA